MKNNEKGITLVALVITIIVLLILAGVTVASLSGENGLLTRGSQAVNDQNIAEAEEKVSLAFDDAMSNYYDAKYVSKNLPAVKAQASKENADKYTAVAYIAQVMMNNDEFKENARFLAEDNSGKIDSASEFKLEDIKGDEETLIIQLTNVRKQDDAQNDSDKPVIETKLVLKGNAAALIFKDSEKAGEPDEKWGYVAKNAGE